MPAADLYLPALPALTASFGAPMGQAQLFIGVLGLSRVEYGLACGRSSAIGPFHGEPS